MWCRKQRANKNNPRFGDTDLTPNKRKLSRGLVPVNQQGVTLKSQQCHTKSNDNNNQIPVFLMQWSKKQLHKHEQKVPGQRFYLWTVSVSVCWIGAGLIDWLKTVADAGSHRTVITHKKHHHPEGTWRRDCIQYRYMIGNPTQWTRLRAYDFSYLLPSELFSREHRLYSSFSCNH